MSDIQQRLAELGDGARRMQVLMNQPNALLALYLQMHVGHGLPGHDTDAFLSNLAVEARDMTDGLGALIQECRAQED